MHCFISCSHCFSGPCFSMSFSTMPLSPHCPASTEWLLPSWSHHAPASILLLLPGTGCFFPSHYELIIRKLSITPFKMRTAGTRRMAESYRRIPLVNNILIHWVPSPNDPCYHHSYPPHVILKHTHAHTHIDRHSKAHCSLSRTDLKC